MCFAVCCCCRRSCALRVRAGFVLSSLLTVVVRGPSGDADRPAFFTHARGRLLFVEGLPMDRLSSLSSVPQQANQHGDAQRRGPSLQASGVALGLLLVWIFLGGLSQVHHRRSFWHTGSFVREPGAWAASWNGRGLCIVARPLCMAPPLAGARLIFPRSPADSSHGSLPDAHSSLAFAVPCMASTSSSPPSASASAQPCRIAMTCPSDAPCRVAPPSWTPCIPLPAFRPLNQSPLHHHRRTGSHSPPPSSRHPLSHSYRPPSASPTGHASTPSLSVPSHRLHSAPITFAFASVLACLCWLLPCSPATSTAISLITSALLPKPSPPSLGLTIRYQVAPLLSPGSRPARFSASQFKSTLSYKCSSRALLSRFQS